MNQLNDPFIFQVCPVIEMGNHRHLRDRSSSKSQNDLLQLDDFLVEMILGEDSDHGELAEVGCEHIMYDGQTLSIPYDLYELPDLKGIISLETWNCLLTEDERFSLARFLPDMDHETFSLTVKELLKGDNLFFGSPLDKFYTGLKGGLHSPRVSCLREGLEFLQKIDYYHRLRSFHKNMTNGFAEMKKLWDRCQPNITVDERIHIWKTRREIKPMLKVDLNALPDENLLNNGDEKIETIQLVKKAKDVNESPESTILLIGLICDTKRKAKGFLKRKSIASIALESQKMQPLTYQTEKPYKQLPKGVLKLKPMYDPPQKDVAKVNLEQIPLDICLTHTPCFSPPQYSLKKDEHNFTEKSQVLCQINRDGNTYRGLDVVQDSQRQEFQDASSESFKDSKIFRSTQNGTKHVRQDAAGACNDWFPLRAYNNLRNYSQEVGQVGEYPDEKNRSNLNTPKSRSIEESYGHSGKECLQVALKKFKGNRLTTIISEAGLGTKNFSDKHNPVAYSYLENGLDVRADVPTSGVENDFMFPLTYKRKKPYKRHSQMDSRKHQPVSLHSADPNGTVKPKPMAIKIKFKGGTDLQFRCHC